MKFLVYSPEQASLLPPTVREVLGGDHLCFFLSRMVKKLDLSAFEQAYSEEGQPGYHPALLVAVWLYATALGVTSSRRLRRAINDLFTQVLEVARDAGLGRLGHVAIDSTRVAANASRNRLESEDALRRERTKLRRQVRRWQQQCDATDPNETPGTAINPQAQRAVQ